MLSFGETASVAAFANTGPTTSQLRDYVSKVINFLKYNRGARSAREIKEKTGVDVKNYDIKQSLEENDKVAIFGNTFQYQPNVTTVKNIMDLRDYIKRKPLGVKESHILDSYNECSNDIEILIQDRRIIRLSHNDTKENVLFFFPGLCKEGDPLNDSEVYPSVDEEIKRRWNDVLISDFKTKEELEKKCFNLRLIDKIKDRKKYAYKININKSKKRKTNILTMKKNITNTHLMVDLENQPN